MTSLLTNVAAMTALQTLQNTNDMMESTQNRISTGYRVAEAKDNAAYWSIASGMRSDNKSISAVQDALGLGAATVDTTYTGLTTSKDVLNEIKAKLTAASQDGVDRGKVQAEIGELQKQLRSISQAATFSGANWLSVNSGDGKFSSDASIISSFSRASGTLTLGTVDIDLNNIKLFDAISGTDPSKGGILDKNVTLLDATGKALSIGGSTSSSALGAGGLIEATAGVGKATVALATEYDVSSNASSRLKFDDIGDKITFSVTVDGGTAQTVSIARGTVQTALNNSADSITIDTAEDYAKVLTQALKDAGVTGVTVGTTPGTTTAGKSVITFTSDTTGPNSNVLVSAATATNGGAADANFTDANANLAAPSGAAEFAPAKATMNTFTAPMIFTGDANLTFEIDLDGAGTPTAVSIDKATVGSALGSTDGRITSAYEFQRVIIAALAAVPVTGVTVGSLAGGAVTFTSQDDTSASAVAISNVVSSPDTTASLASGDAAEISVVDIDVTDAALEARAVVSDADKREVLTAYMNIVDQAIQNVTSAAATLGSVSSRIEMQKTFLQKLTDTIEKGVGTLVDADMTKESTRLKALQTQQQLGVQSLSIANQSSQALLQLFQ